MFRPQKSQSIAPDQPKGTILPDLAKNALLTHDADTLTYEPVSNGLDTGIKITPLQVVCNHTYCP